MMGMNSGYVKCIQKVSRGFMLSVIFCLPQTLWATAREMIEEQHTRHNTAVQTGYQKDHQEKDAEKNEDEDRFVIVHKPELIRLQNILKAEKEKNKAIQTSFDDVQKQLNETLGEFATAKAAYHQSQTEWEQQKAHLMEEANKLTKELSLAQENLSLLQKACDDLRNQLQQEKDLREQERRNNTQLQTQQKEEIEILRQENLAQKARLDEQKAILGEQKTRLDEYTKQLADQQNAEEKRILICSQLQQVVELKDKEIELKEEKLKNITKDLEHLQKTENLLRNHFMTAMKNAKAQQEEKDKIIQELQKKIDALKAKNNALKEQSRQRKTRRQSALDDDDWEFIDGNREDNMTKPIVKIY